MSHLNPSELIDLLDGTLPPDRRAHARECPRCRDEAERARLALDDAREVEMREPSPLFWPQFAARVRRALDAEPPPSRWLPHAWRLSPVALGVLAAAIVAAGVTVAWLLRPLPSGLEPPASGIAAVQPFPGAASAPPLENGEADAGWDLVAGFAESLEWDEVASAGVSLRPGAAERALLQLSEEQQEELVRLLEAEIGRLPS
jgi:hypothetical protein